MWIKMIIVTVYLNSGFGKFKELFWSLNCRGCTTSIWCCIYLLSSWTSCSISVLSGFKVIFHLTILLHSSGVRQLGSAVLLVTLVRCGWLVTMVKLPPIVGGYSKNNVFYPKVKKMGTVFLSVLHWKIWNGFNSSSLRIVNSGTSSRCKVWLQICCLFHLSVIWVVDIYHNWLKTFIFAGQTSRGKKCLFLGC